MNTDPIADLLTRIRNATSAGHDFTRVPYSKIKENILVVLKNNGFIESYQKAKSGKFDELVIDLKKGKKSIHLKRISKTGQRIYIKRKELKSIRSGLGLNILSTPKGIMTGEEARKQNLGGELICEVY
ncbi:MAG: 30S ribosomal protein S8 [Patescibacteria group bacterium]|nr:30S ribosomal protein S8 [Patescibacteria group bacterium]